MIENFQDHAANERTFLSWVRTSIAIVGIGIVVANIGGLEPASITGTKSGVWLLILGTMLIVAAGIRFMIIRQLIRSEKVTSTLSVKLDMTLAIVLIVMIATLVGFGANISDVL